LGDGVRIFVPGALACLASVSYALAQQAAPQTAAPSFEIVTDNIDLEAAPDGRFWMTSEVAYRPLNIQGVEALQQFNLSYTAGYQDQTVSAYTLKKDGRHINVPPSGILRGQGQSTMPGFEDTRTQTVVMPDLEVGDEVVLTTTTRQSVPWFPNVFAMDISFSRAVAVHEASLAFTTEGNDSAFRISAAGVTADAPQTLGGKTRRVWHFQNEKAAKFEPDAVTEADDAPHVDITTLGDYAAVAKLYAGVFRDKAEVTSDISVLANRVTAGIGDRRGQAKILYDWVSSHIHYVDIVLGAGGFEPHRAADVLKNGYGDCKDHVMLLEALLAAKGIKSSAVLIMAGTGQFRLPTSPSPFLFNHLITYVPEFQLFLDSTAQYAPFGVLPSSDSGRPVVIVNSGRTAVTPRISASTTSLYSETVLKLNADGSADGDSKVRATGALAVDMRAMIAALPADGEDNFFRLLLGPGSTGKLDRDDPQNLTEDYAYSAHYHVGHLAALPGPGALPVALAYEPFSFAGLIGGLPSSRDTDYLCASGSFSDNVTLSLPPGTTILSLPPSRDFATDGTELQIDYRQAAPDQVRIRRRLTLDQPGPVCTATYYNKVRPELSGMTAALLAQILYK
jgi:hypothetical protein